MFRSREIICVVAVVGLRAGFSAVADALGLTAAFYLATAFPVAGGLLPASKANWRKSGLLSNTDLETSNV
jgi:hypothetical protein